MTADTVVAIWAPILTGRLRLRLQRRQRYNLDSGLLEGVADRGGDLRCVRRVAVDADALDAELEFAALDRPDGAVPDEPDRPRAHLLGVAALLDPLEHELPGRVVVEVDVALGDKRDTRPFRGRPDLGG